jgi:ATP-binding protein involved in chromosome partitioning
MNKNQEIGKTVLPNIKNIIMVASGKGGVGKSTVAAGMAMSLAEEGYSVGLMDADIYGPSVPTLFNLRNEHPTQTHQDDVNKINPIVRFGIKVMSMGFFMEPNQAVLWRGPLASRGLTQLLDDTGWEQLDYLIIDTPPGTGDIHITLLQQYQINGVVIVTTPQTVAISDVKKAISMFNNPDVNVPVIGIVENMAWFTPSKHPDEKYYLFGQGGGELLSKIFNVALIAQIPMNETISNSCDAGKLNELFYDSQVKSGFDKITDRILELTQIKIMK